MTSSVKLFVASLDKRVTNADLEFQFKKFGSLISAFVIRNENGCSKGFGFVHFLSMADGLKAVEAMDGSMLYSKRIHVKISNMQEGYRCYNEPFRTTWSEESCYDFNDLKSEVADLQEDQPNYNTGDCEVKERMRKLLEKELYSDVIFYPKDNSNVSISAHKAILAVGSPVFEVMLYSKNNQSKVPPGAKMEIYIQNIPFLVFKSIVRYLYTNDVFFENEAQVQDILNGAEQFEIQSLVERCNSYFEETELTSESVCSKLKLSYANKIEALKERCVEYIQKNTHQVLRSSDFLNSPADTIQRICKLQSLNLKEEMELIERAILWLNNQPSVQRKESTQSLLKCFRFLTLSVAEMSLFLTKYPDVIDAPDGLKIILYLSNPSQEVNQSSLPSWCNKSTDSRCVFSPTSQQGNYEECAGFQRNYTKDKSIKNKIILPLKLSKNYQCLTDATSLVTMKCISGQHQIFAMTLSFQPPVSSKSTIEQLSIDARVDPRGFYIHECIEIVNSLDVRFEFQKRIFAREGDVVHFKVKASNIQSYKFYEFDDAVPQKTNPHFICTVSSKPRESRIFCISEIEYEDQIHRNTALKS